MIADRSSLQLVATGLRDAGYVYVNLDDCCEDIAIVFPVDMPNKM